MRAKQIITDMNHDRVEVEVFPSVKLQRAYELHKSEKPLTGFQGFGVAITGGSCYELSRMQPEERRALLKKVYTAEGANLSVARLPIGACDYSAELYSYDDVEGDVELEHFSIERDLRYIVPMIKEILKVRPDLYILASPWSPPGWMKTGGNLCGGAMRACYIECYAEYIIKFVKAYAELGIPIHALTPQNEPNTHQRSKMPACIWHPEIEAEYIKVLRRKLKENGLDIRIWMYDHDFADVNRVMWMLEHCEGVRENVDGAAFHYYSGTIEETLCLRRAYPELQLHFTEAGPRLHDHYADDWCKWGIMIAKAIKCGYSSFTGWNLLLNEMGGPNIGPHPCAGLATRHSVTGEISYSGQYKAFAHIAPHITPGSKLYSLRVGEEYDLEMSKYPLINRPVEGFAIDNDDGRWVLVLINPNNEKRQVQVCMDGQWWYIELTAESISTVTIDK
ncbi:MAG: hypothetical protein IKW00_09065 [Clostridia bacterium]|nr:hypothetical protein [Clostridia bacterium]